MLAVTCEDVPAVTRLGVTVSVPTVCVAAGATDTAAGFRLDDIRVLAGFCSRFLALELADTGAGDGDGGISATCGDGVGPA